MLLGGTGLPVFFNSRSLLSEITERRSASDGGPSRTPDYADTFSDNSVPQATQEKSTGTQADALLLQYLSVDVGLKRMRVARNRDDLVHGAQLGSEVTP